MRGGLINGKGEERKARMPYSFHLSMSVFGTIKFIEDVGCCNKLKNYYILFLKKILDFEYSSLKSNFNVTLREIY